MDLTRKKNQKWKNLKNHNFRIMPRYIYKFKDTGETVEVNHSINKPPLHEIDGRPVERIISNTSFLLKGNGFYGTDYNKNGSKR